LDDRTKSQLQRLQPKAAELAKQLITKAKEGGIVIKVIAGLRTVEEQEALYARGRTVPGLKVTNAKRSVHNTGLAFDVGIFEGDRLVDESPKYKEVGTIGKSLGLVWGGDWRPIPDEPHFETADAQDALRQLKPTP
jgi:peptidoglycan L-alanyl-D-glutamate endopeptidase CwlK